MNDTEHHMVLKPLENIEESVKRKDKLNESEIHRLFLNIINRKRFEFGFGAILENIVKCIYCRSGEAKKLKYKLHRLYDRCEEKLEKELDIVSVLKHGRLTKLIAQAVLN